MAEESKCVEIMVGPDLYMYRIVSRKGFEQKVEELRILTEEEYSKAIKLLKNNGYEAHPAKFIHPKAPTLGGFIFYNVDDKTLNELSKMGKIINPKNEEGGRLNV